LTCALSTGNDCDKSVDGRRFGAANSPGKGCGSSMGGRLSGAPERGMEGRDGAP
jgi:hypothetical protein